MAAAEEAVAVATAEDKNQKGRFFLKSKGTVLFDSKKIKKTIKLNESGQKEPSLMIFLKLSAYLFIICI